MSLRTNILGSAAVAVALLAPAAASAQGYYGSGYNTYGSGYGAYGSAYGASDPCRNVRQGRQATGAVIGGVLGGLLGAGVAADKNQDEGAALGAVLGAVAGASVANRSVDCGVSPYGHSGVSTVGYGSSGYGTSGYGSSGYGYSGAGQYGQGHYGSSGTRGPTDTGYGHDPYGYGHSDRAATQCETVYRTTRLPDGREIREPVQACRDAYYGDWDVETRGRRH